MKKFHFSSMQLLMPSASDLKEQQRLQSNLKIFCGVGIVNLSQIWLIGRVERTA